MGTLNQNSHQETWQLMQGSTEEKRQQNLAQWTLKLKHDTDPKTRMFNILKEIDI